MRITMPVLCRAHSSPAHSCPALQIINTNKPKMNITIIIKKNKNNHHKPVIEDGLCAVVGSFSFRRGRELDNGWLWIILIPNLIIIYINLLDNSGDIVPLQDSKVVPTVHSTRTWRFTMLPNFSKYPLSLVMVFKSLGIFLRTIVSLERPGCGLAPPPPGPLPPP